MAQIVVTLRKQFAENCTLDTESWNKLRDRLPLEWEIAGVKAKMLAFQFRGMDSALVTFEVADSDVVALYASALGGRGAMANVTAQGVEIVPKRPRGRPRKDG